MISQNDPRFHQACLYSQAVPSSSSEVLVLEWQEDERFGTENTLTGFSMTGVLVIMIAGKLRCTGNGTKREPCQSLVSLRWC